MHAENCVFLAPEYSNRVHNDLDELMDALFFISGRRQLPWPEQRAPFVGRSFALSAGEATSPAFAGEATEEWRVVGAWSRKTLGFGGSLGGCGSLDNYTHPSRPKSLQ